MDQAAAVAPRSLLKDEQTSLRRGTRAAFGLNIAEQSVLTPWSVKAIDFVAGF
jgi:hypothetical protein